MDNKVVEKFINSFVNYLLESRDNAITDIAYCAFEEVFQVFGRKVENELGRKIFEGEK